MDEQPRNDEANSFMCSRCHSFDIAFGNPRLDWWKHDAKAKQTCVMNPVA